MAKYAILKVFTKQFRAHHSLGKASKKKLLKSGEKLSYLGLFCHFIKDKMGQHFHKIEAVRLEGGDPPPSGQQNLAKLA